MPESSANIVNHSIRSLLKIFPQMENRGLLVDFLEKFTWSSLVIVITIILYYVVILKVLHLWTRILFSMCHTLY